MHFCLGRKLFHITSHVRCWATYVPLEETTNQIRKERKKERKNRKKSESLYALCSEKYINCSINRFLELVYRCNYLPIVSSRSGIKDARLETKAKDTKKIWGQGQGQPFRGQTLSRPRTGMLEAKAKDQGHSHKCSQKKKVFKKVFQTISNLSA